MRQLGVLTSEILNSPFEKIGSLCEQEGKFHVGERLSRALTWSSRDSFCDIARGPFSNDKDYYESILLALCHHAGRLPLEHHLFLAPVPKVKDFQTLSSYQSTVQLWNDFVTVDSKIDSSKNRLDYITTAHLLRNVILSISTYQQRYYLKPPEYSLSNIFIDDDFNITCIIDWTCCFTVPLSMLLIAASFPQPRDEMDAEMISTFKKSVIGHSPQMKEVLEDPLSWDLAQKSRLFMQLINLDGLEDCFKFIELYTSAHPDTNQTDLRRLSNSLRENDKFIGQAKSLLEEDLLGSVARKKEKGYFTCSRPGDEDLARKLSAQAGTERSLLQVAGYGNQQQLSWQELWNRRQRSDTWYDLYFRILKVDQ